MSICRTDIKNHIINDINENFINGRNTFNKISNGKVAVTNQGKASSRSQAYEIANNLVKRIKERYNNLATGIIYEGSPSDPIIVEYSISDNLIDYYYNQIPVENRLGNQQNQLFQDNNIESTTASPKVIKAVKELLNRWGVDLEIITKDEARLLARNAGASKNATINGIADLLQKIVWIQEGKENIALTEEAMHFAVAILKQTNPTLFKEMFNKIGSYKIYQLVKDNPQYQTYRTKDGKLDIPKLKEEAIGKLLAEYYISQIDNTSVSENLLSEEQSKIDQVQGFWNKLLEWFKKLFIKAGYNPFEEAASQLANNQPIGTAVDINEQSSFFNIENDFANKLFSNLDQKIKDYNLVKHEDKSDPDDENNNSYYTITINGKEKKVSRTTEWAKEQNIKRYGGKDYLSTATDEQKKEWAIKAMSGTNGHLDIENIIKASINEDGTLKDIEDINLNFTNYTNIGVFNKLKLFLLGGNTGLLGNIQQEGFLQSFPIGTKFRTEQQIFNEGTNRAGTIDLIAVLPDGKVKIYDWKFMGFSLKTNIDQPIQKRRQHQLQLGDYKLALKKAYGVKEVEAFTIPIHAIYGIKQIDNEKQPFLKSISIGKVNIKDEERTYLLPVSPTDQSTGNEVIDETIEKLQSYYKKLYDKPVAADEKYLKIDQLNQLSVAIRHLQVRLNFEPLSAQASTFKDSIQQVIDKYKKVDLSTISAEEINSSLQELIDTYNSADVFSELDQAFINEYGTENLSEKDKKTLDTLTLSGSTAIQKKKEVLNIITKFIDYTAINNGITNIIKPEKEIKGIINSFTETLNLPSRMLKLFATINTKTRNWDDIVTHKEIKKFGDIYLKANELAKQKGISVYDLIAQKDSLKLKRKTKKEFWSDLKEAKETKNKKFILENIYLNKYNELSKNEIEKRTKQIEDTTYSTDDKLNERTKKNKIAELSRTLDIEAKDFNGYNDRTFGYLINKVIREDLHYTDEYKELLSEPAAIDLYNYIYNLNKKAYATGYLDNYEGLSFLPFIEGTILDRLLKSSNAGQSIKSLIKQAYTVTSNEEASYGKIDEETGKPKKTIPKYFTKQKGNLEDYSKDLLKIIPLYIQALQEYASSKEMENTFNAMYIVEKNKTHLEIDRNGNVIYEGSIPKEYTGNEENANLLLKNIEDSIFGIHQDNDTFVDLALDKISKRDDENKEKTKLVTKKVIQNSNKYTQGLAVGLKALVAIPNYVGAHIQGIINSGNYYSPKEYESNHFKLIGSLFTGTEGNIKKALIDLIIPLNEDIVKETSRKIAKKQSALKWLSTWTFQDVLMSTNQIPDKAHQLTNAISWLENSMVDNGKIVNIRQYLNKLDRTTKYNLSHEERKKLEKSFNQRVKEIKEEKSLVKIAKFNENGILEIPGIDLDSKEFATYRNQIIEFGRYITGQMSSDNKADYRRNIITSSFMMFKNWIPKQIFIRTQDIQKNPILDEWEYGRGRLFVKTLFHLGLKNIKDIRDISNGSPKGLKIMNDILQQKKEEYKKKTGQELEITDEEFYDLMRQQLKNQYKELAILIGLVALVWGAKIAAPDSDDDDKNKYKFIARGINKISDELWFYYSPTSAESITRGTILPSLGILSKASAVLSHTGQEILGIKASNYNLEFFNEDVQEKNQTIKYWANLFPVASQFQNELLPIINPEMAKELGIRLTSEARAFR